MIKIILIIIAALILIGVLVYFFVPLKMITVNPERTDQSEKKVPLYEYYQTIKIQRDI